MTAAMPAPITAPARVQRRRAPRDIGRIRKLLWIYFWLFIFEGALRKWVVPFAANPLLVVRDPVVLLAYFYAWRIGLFPRNNFVLFGGALGLVSLLAGLIATEGAAFVVVYGFRANFLHLPLIFLVGKVFDVHDVRRIGYWVLVLSIPMALLMAVQFISPPQSWINAGTEGNFQQLSLGASNIRAAGTFSYISGPVAFFSWAAVFLLYSQNEKLYPRFLVLASSLATIIAAAVSGSRSLVLAIFIVVFLAFVSSTLAKPKLALRWLASFVVVGLLFYLLRNVPVIQLGLSVFTTRVTTAAGHEGGASGFLFRILQNFGGAAYPSLFESPVLGYGLGMGTNVGAVLVTGKAQFLLAEIEWQRNILESGPFLGGAFIIYRLVLCGWLVAIAIRHALRKNLLPLLLLSAGGLILVNGNLGQPTSLGFTVFTCGLCLAATRVPQRKKLSIRPAFAARPESRPTVANATSSHSLNDLQVPS